MEYDFSVLNDRDFEALTSDLLSELYGARIERFKPGRDQGVDGRWFSVPHQETIIQCKRWLSATFPSFLSELKLKEKPKIERLSPKRYILATTLPLSRDNKAKLFDLLSPYIINPSDIFGREDLHDLLIKYPAIERRHPKLWAATATVIGRIINAGLVGRTGFVLDEVKDFARRYVDTSDCINARKLLEEKRALIIKGGPGVGKTTLANQMLCEYTAMDYEPFVIEDIEEAENVFDDSAKQFFLYDDFLGSNFLEVIHNKEDSRLVSFIRRVLRFDNKILVLTTRSHILDQGKDCSEALRLQNTSRREIELRVGSISDLDKGKILYAHMFSGGLPDYALDAIYESQRYLKLIKHENFNPRLVGFITDPERFGAIAPDKYWSYVQDSFDNPSAIWKHVFERQISKDAGVLGLLVYANGRSIFERDLRTAFASFVDSDSNSWEFLLRFDTALKVAVGSILNRSIIANSGCASISLFNPSVGDFLEGQIIRLGALRNLTMSLQTAASVRHLDSLCLNNKISKETQIFVLREIVNNAPAVSPVTDAVIKAMLHLILTPGEEELPTRRLNELAEYVNVDLCGVLEDLIDLLASALDNHDGDGYLSLSERTLARLEDRGWNASDDALHSAVKLAIKLDDINPNGRYEALRAGVIDVMENTIHELAHDADVLSEFIDPSEEYVARQTLEDFVKDKLENIGISVDATEIRKISNYVDIEDVIYSNFKSAMRSDEGGRTSSPPISSTTEVIDYFGERNKS